MQLFTLNADFKKNVLQEGYFSLIWTERYRPCGDFELKTYLINECLAAMPIGARVSLTDSREVMFVETHEIAVDESKKKVLTVSGRSYESFYENRITLTDETSIRSAIEETNATIITNQRAAISARNILRNSYGTGIDNNNIIHDVVANIDASVYSGDPLADRFILRGSAYDEFVKVLEEENLGVRNIRPNSQDPGILEHLIYSGEDKSSQIAFSVMAGHITGNVRYRWSSVGQKSGVYVAGKSSFVKVFNPGYSTSVSTTHRIDLLDVPDVTQTGTQAISMLTAKGRAYLQQHQRVMFLEGAISPDAPFIFGTDKDYYLGDTVSLQGEYGVSQDMQVVEYIRVEDESGDRGYPTLN